ncbi:hypothetical protein EB001_18905, partial [bacterium]|nr:hypothetical protein [bacterium]
MAKPLKHLIGPETTYLPPINSHDDVIYMTEFTTSSSIVAFILDAFTEVVFTEEKDRAFKEKAHPKLVQKLLDIQTSTPITPHRNLEDLLTTCEPLRNLYTVAEFLRSYIDFHHDYKYMAYNLILPIRDRFEENILPSIGAQRLYKQKKYITLEQWYNNWIDKLEDPKKGIYCAENDGIWNVSETRCRELLNNLIDELLEFAQNPDNVTPDGVINWIPLTHMIAEVAPPFTVRSVSGSNERYDATAITALRTLLNNKGVTQCFAESLGNGFYNSFLTALSKDGKTGMQNVIMPVAAWDGGSGFTRKHNVILSIDQPISSIARPLPIFGGVANVAVNFHTLRCSFSPGETLQITGVQELGLNSILKKCGLNLLRGSTDEEKIHDLKHIEYTPPQILTFLPILKTWTDLVQLRVLSQLHRKGQPNIAICTLDICCEYSARMYGLPYVMLTSKNTVSLSCYDLQAMKSFQHEQQLAKAQTLASVLLRTDLNMLVTSWFDKKLELLKHIKSHTVDPALFFGIRRFQSSFEVYKTEANKELKTIRALREALEERNVSAIKKLYPLLQTFPTNLNEWLHRITNSERIRSDFDETYHPLREVMQRIKSTSVYTMDKWLTLHGEVTQLVVNACPVTIKPLRLRMYILCVFVVAYMEKGDVSRSIEALRILQANEMKRVLENMLVADGPHMVQAFVSVETMTGVFIPPASIKPRGPPLEKEWEIRMCATDFAKNNSWTPAGNGEASRALSDAMGAYHAILQDREFAQMMEDTLLIGTILHMMHSRVPNIFTFINTEFIKFNKNERAGKIKAIMTDSTLTANQRKQQLAEINQPMYNNTRTYHFNSWDELFRPTKAYTLSLIDPVTESFYGLEERTWEYMGYTLSCPIEEKLSSLVHGRTRPLWDPNPTLGMKRPTRKANNISKNNNNMNQNTNNPSKRTKKHKPTKKGGQRAGTKKHNKTYMFPRRFSKTYCKKRACNKMGFTEKASCRPYKNCYRLFLKKSTKNSRHISRKSVKNSKVVSRKSAKNSKAVSRKTAKNRKRDST